MRLSWPCVRAAFLTQRASSCKLTHSSRATGKCASESMQRTLPCPPANVGVVTALRRRPVSQGAVRARSKPGSDSSRVPRRMAEAYVAADFLDRARRSEDAVTFPSLAPTPPVWQRSRPFNFRHGTVSILLLPRLIRLRDAANCLGMDRNRFNAGAPLGERDSHRHPGCGLRSP